VSIARWSPRCWTPTLPLMAENNPRVLFERMFGAADEEKDPARRRRVGEDGLDLVRQR